MRKFIHTSILLILSFTSVFVAIAQRDSNDTDESSLDSLLNIKVSTATKYWQTISEAPASVTIITATQIERYGYRTLEDVFRSVRGFYISNDRNYSYIGIRGFSRPSDYNDRLLLLFDGHTLNENIYGGASIGNDLPIDMSSIERIEIVRGPGSALYGTGAMFSVVNIIPKRGNDIDGLHLSTDVGSFGRIGGSMTYGRQIDEHFDLFISAQGADIQGDDLYYSDFNDPLTNNGIAEGIDWEQFFGFHTTVRYNEWTTRALYTSRKKSVPTGAYGTMFNHPGFESTDKRAFLELQYDLALSHDKNFSLRGYYDYFDYWGSYPYPSTMNYDASIGKWFGGETKFRWDLFAGNRLTVGGEYNNNPRADYKNWTADTVYFDNNFPFNTYSVYLQDEFQIADNLAFIAGVRRDEYSSKDNAITPRIAIIFNPFSAGTFKLLYGEGFRAPNAYESNYEDVLSQWKISSHLRSERIKTTELVYEHRVSNNTLGILSTYSYRMTDLIDSYKDEFGVSQFLNVSEVTAFGLEAELNFRTEYGLKGTLSGAYQTAKDPSNDAILSNSPKFIGRCGASYQLTDELIFATECIYNSQRITVFETTTDPFFLTKINLSFDPFSNSDNWYDDVLNHAKLTLLIDNVFNTTYATPGGIEHLQQAILQDGRNFRMKLTCSF